MKAELRTLCGCTRKLEVTYPPPKELLLPLHGNHMSWFGDVQPADPVDPNKTRTFRLVGAEKYGYQKYRPRDIAYYTEAE